MNTHFTYSVRVYWEDTDAGGVVYYANYLKFMERARTEWLRSLGFEQDTLRDKDQRVFVVRRVEIDYLAPARLDDLLTLDTQLAGITRTSMTVTQKIGADKPLTQARVQLACVDAVSFKPARMPATLLEKLPPP